MCVGLGLNWWGKKKFVLLEFLNSICFFVPCGVTDQVSGYKFFFPLGFSNWWVSIFFEIFRNDKIHHHKKFFFFLFFSFISSSFGVFILFFKHSLRSWRSSRVREESGSCNMTRKEKEKKKFPAPPPHPITFSHCRLCFEEKYSTPHLIGGWILFVLFWFLMSHISTRHTRMKNRITNEQSIDLGNVTLS